MSTEKMLNLNQLSPRALELLEEFARTSGVDKLERVVEEQAFSIFELMRLIDTTRDPKIYPQDAILVFNTVRAVLEKFKRFGSPKQLPIR